MVRSTCADGSKGSAGRRASCTSRGTPTCALSTSSGRTETALSWRRCVARTAGGSSSRSSGSSARTSPSARATPTATTGPGSAPSSTAACCVTTRGGARRPGGWRRPSPLGRCPGPATSRPPPRAALGIPRCTSRRTPRGRSASCRSPAAAPSPWRSSTCRRSSPGPASPTAPRAPSCSPGGCDAAPGAARRPSRCAGCRAPRCFRCRSGWPGSPAGGSPRRFPRGRCSPWPPTTSRDRPPGRPGSPCPGWTAGSRSARRATSRRRVPRPGATTWRCPAPRTAGDRVLEVQVAGGRFVLRLSPAAMPTVAGDLPLPYGTWLLLVRPDDDARAGEDGEEHGVPLAAEPGVLARLPMEHAVGTKPFTVTEEDGDLVLEVGPDLRDDERGPVNQHRLRWQDFPAFLRQGVRDEVLFESYESRAYGDNARAIYEELRRRVPGLPCRWM